MKHWVVSIVVFLTFFLGGIAPQFAQNTTDENTRLVRQHVAIGLVRSINTAEVTNKMTNGSFLNWKELLSQQPKYFESFLAKDAPDKTTHFADAPEILPGWNLRLNVHADGQGYDILLRDTTDEKCSYAVSSDETGVIRQSKALDCEISK